MDHQLKIGPFEKTLQLSVWAGLWCRCRSIPGIKDRRGISWELRKVIIVDATGLGTMDSWMVATQIFLIFTRKIGGNDPIWLIFFRWGWNHQLDRIGVFCRFVNISRPSKKNCPGHNTLNTSCLVYSRLIYVSDTQNHQQPSTQRFTHMWCATSAAQTGSSSSSWWTTLRLRHLLKCLRLCRCPACLYDYSELHSGMKRRIMFDKRSIIHFCKDH